jgi:hypothetical protein
MFLLQWISGSGLVGARPPSQRAASSRARAGGTRGREQFIGEGTVCGARAGGAVRGAGCAGGVVRGAGSVGCGEEPVDALRPPLRISRDIDKHQMTYSWIIVI